MLKKLTPHLISIACLLILSMACFYPQLTGKGLQQGDIISHRGASKEVVTFKKETGEQSLWTNSMFGGMPTYQISTKSKTNLLQYVNQVIRLGFKHPIGGIFVAMLGFYILMIVLGASPWLSLVAAIAFGFTTNNFVLLEAGHNTKLNAIGYFPMVVAGVIMAYRKNVLLGVALFGLGLGLNVLVNHPQMTYYLLLILLIYAVLEGVDHIKANKLLPFAKTSGLLIVAAVLAVGSASGKLLTTYEYSKDTMRGDPILEKSGEPVSSSETSGLEWTYAMAWSNGFMDLVATVIPKAAGGGSGEMVGPESAFAQELRKRGANVQGGTQAPLYWGALPFTSGPAYFGAIVWFLFIFGLLQVKGKMKWWLASAALLTILMSMGKNFEILNRLLFNVLPLYNKFRAPSSVLSITAFILPVLGFYALANVKKTKKGKQDAWRNLKKAGIITGAVVLLFALLGPSLFDFSSPGDARYADSGLVPSLIEDRKSGLRSDGFRSFLLIAISFGLIWAYLQNKIKAAHCFLGLGVLMLFDLWMVGKRYLDESDFTDDVNYASFFTPRNVDQQILQDKDLDYRVLDLSVNTFNSAVPSYFHKTIGGYHAAKLQRYQDMIDQHIEPEIRQLSQVLPAVSRIQNDSAKIAKLSVLKSLNMLNTKYIIAGQEGKEQIFPNPAALGNAWFVDQFNIAKNANEEISLIKTIDPSNTAVVHSDYAGYVDGLGVGSGTITLEEYRPNYLKYTCNATSEQLAVFSEIWYGPNKGWKASIDGKQTDHIRVNYCLRGLKVPPGSHTIEFRFDPDIFKTGETASLICSLIILIGFAGAFGWKFAARLREPVIKVEKKPKRKATPKTRRKKN